MKPKLSGRERAEKITRAVASVVFTVLFVAACITVLALGAAAIIGAVRLVQLVVGLI